MQDIKIYAPGKISPIKLRNDLECVLKDLKSWPGEPRDYYRLWAEEGAYLNRLIMLQSGNPQEINPTRDENYHCIDAYPLYYAVGRLKLFNFPAGRVVTLTNDLGVFSEFAPLVFGNLIWYSAVALLSGFEENKFEFLNIKQNLEALNNWYQK